MGGVELDFTEAELPPGLTELNIFAVMGGCDIKVPAGLDVEVTGVPILGGVENNSRGNTGSGGPLLRIRAFVVMGGVEVKVSE